jgi:hypothetical protein
MVAYPPVPLYLYNEPGLLTRYRGRYSLWLKAGLPAGGRGFDS